MSEKLLHFSQMQFQAETCLRPIADSPPDCVVICCSGGGGGWPFSGSGRSGTGSGSGGLFYIERCCHPGRHQWARSHVTFSGVVRPAGGVTCPSTQNLAICASALDITDRDSMSTAD